ncbi:serine/threonine protein kinase [Streptomyces viridochromogenes DSM 40736]|uniref:non-specific serine/threonine protein kinase n=1 Tax=Streptomyces viridochromogenes (strain DSM 40736 / JCM 4977 / BCRC 1201 / Tue 494) TaxID=591159 RepID=D9X9V5_STRVT|nr:serine/threonine-protein kinase [Streptomyces viridochromogenes]EFL34335.1 serine/threonine protein kinase [Streptomyces viridochromogenes DSM 40736]
MSNDGGGVGDARGRLVGGRYRLIERIGSGGTGTVWRAHDELAEREVAVRQPRLPGDPDDESYRRAAHLLYREARAAARVDHPAAVTIHDVVVEAEQPDARDGLEAVDTLDRLPWIVMESVPGESLHAVLGRGPVEAREAARIGLAVVGALRAAHSVGIVHRDVKPANVLLGPHRRVVLTDFGIAHQSGEETPASGGGFGDSLEFVAPERMSGRIAGPASDLWSLGVLLYAAVEGSSPFRRTTPESTLAAVLAADPPDPKQAGPLGPLIARLLVRDPGERPDAEEVAKQLAAVAGPSPAEEQHQDAERTREFTQDTGPEHPEEAAGPSEPDPSKTNPPDTDPTARHDSTARHDPAAPKRHSLFRPAPLALLSALLAGGIGTATHLADTSSAESAEQTAAGTTDTWIPHPEPDMAAVLHLPPHYRPLDRTGSATDQPRTVLYGDPRGGTIQVRLLQWDKADKVGKAPDSPTDRAGTTDTTYHLDDAPRRVMRVLIRTDDDRVYELRVDMPKGTPEEKEGVSVFEGARDRLGIGPGS